MKLITATVVALVVAAPCSAFTVNTQTTFVNRLGVKLHMVEEIVEGASAAFNVLPLLAGPTAAFAAGQAALSQKKKIESEVEYAARELDDVKRRLKDTDTLINGSFGLAVVSAGFAAVQAFGGESLLTQANIETIDGIQEFVFPSSSQQLAAEDQSPTTNSIKELLKVDRSKSVPEKKIVTTDSDYNSLYKSIESAGKTVGETVENNKPILTATAPGVKKLIGDKINNEVILPPKTALEISDAVPSIAAGAKVDDSAVKIAPVEKVSSVIGAESKSTEGVLAVEKLPTTPVVVAKEESVTTSPPEKNLNEKSSPVAVVESKKNDEPVLPKDNTVDKNLNEKPSPILAVESKKVDDPVLRKDFSVEKNVNENPSPILAVESKKVDEPVLPKDSLEKSLNEKPSPMIAVESKKDDEPVVIKGEKGTVPATDSVTTITASTEKLAPVSVLKVGTVDEKSLAQSMVDAGKAGSDLVQPTTTTEIPDKQSIDTSPTYDSLFKKIEAAGKSSDDVVKSTAIASEQLTPSKIAVTTVESVVSEGSKTDPSVMKPKDTSSDANTPVIPSISSTDDASRDSSSTGVYMKEAVSALSSLGLPKGMSPLANSPEYKLPTFNAPELSLSSFNMPDLSIPDINLPSMEDIPLAAKVAAGVFAVGGSGIAIALSLNKEESVGSTMPIGAKKKGTSYLEGLSRSSTTLANNGANGSNSYLNDLAANAVSPPQGQATNGPYDFSPKPAVTAVQESSVSPSFNFAPSTNANTGKESSQYQATSSVNGGDNFKVPNGEKKTDSSSPSFNFSPKLFDFANKRQSSESNGQDTNGNFSPKPEPPMGGESLGNSEKVDWGNKGVDGGYLWGDPAQKAGSGVGAYLDNLATKSVGPNPYTSPSNPEVGSYNSYLEAMNQQPTQQYQDANQPSTVKTFSKTPRTGSYVDSL